MACKGKLDKCVLKDDLAEVLDSIRDANVLVLATPVYFGEVTSQMKGFIDRTYSYLVPDYMSNPKPSRLTPGKKLVFIQAQGQPNEKMYADVFPRYERFFKWYGFQDMQLIRACGVRGPEEVAARAEALKEVEELAKKMVA